MTQILDLLVALRELPLETQERIQAFVDLVLDGDERAREVLGMLGRKELLPEEALDTLETYLAARH